MNQVIAIGIDTSKSYFALSGADATGKEILRDGGTKARIMKKLAKLPPTLVGIEACRGSHVLARELVALGHDARIVPPQHAKPFVKRNKNDAADARAICRAVREPDTTVVPIKTEAQQADAMLVDHRRALQERRTEIGNRIRGYAAEFGIEAGQGIRQVATILARVLAREDLPAHARLVFEDLAEDWERLAPRIAAAQAQLEKTARGDGECRRMMEVPCVGPVVAFRTKTVMGDPRRFSSGRAFAGWMGLTPRDHTTANKQRLGGITRAGDMALRADLVSGATSLLQQIARRGPQACGGGRLVAWAAQLLSRMSFKAAAVALANRVARILWKLMISGERYDRDHGPALASLEAAA